MKLLRLGLKDKMTWLVLKKQTTGGVGSTKLVHYFPIWMYMYVSSNNSTFGTTWDMEDSVLSESPMHV